MDRTPLVEMKGVHKRFGGVHAVNDVSVDLYPGEVVGVLGHNGAGKSVLMTMLSGALPTDEGEIRIHGKPVAMHSPRDALTHGIETIYQTLALADNLNASANLFLGRELKTRWGTLDDDAMEAHTTASIRRLNVDALDLTQLHCIPTKELLKGEVFDHLRRLKEQGKIRAFGVSGNDAASNLAPPSAEQHRWIADYYDREVAPHIREPY